MEKIIARDEIRSRAASEGTGIESSVIIYQFPRAVNNFMSLHYVGQPQVYSNIQKKICENKK